MEDTERDVEEQWRFEPIKKRRNKSPADNASGETRQGILF